MNSFDILAIIYYVVFGVLLIGTIWFVLDLEFNKNHLMNATPVKFKEFRKWYVVAPDKYLLMDTYAFRKDCFISVIFNNPIDALRYRSFAKKVRKSNNLEEYQKYVKKDMDAVYQMVKSKKK